MSLHTDSVCISPYFNDLKIGFSLLNGSEIRMYVMIDHCCPDSSCNVIREPCNYGNILKDGEKRRKVLSAVGEPFFNSYTHTGQVAIPLLQDFTFSRTRMWPRVCIANN
jgi:hypothetical protein